MKDKLINRSVEEYVEKTKDTSSIPGGGSICALCGALSGSLGIMVEKLSHRGAGIDEISINELSRQIDQLKINIDRDAHSFNQVLEAMKLPKETEGEREVRAQAMEAGYIHATEVPVEVIEGAVEILKLLLPIAKRGSIYAITDTYIAADLALTSIKGAAMTASLNIGHMKNEVIRKAMSDKIKNGLDLGERYHQEIQSEVRKMMEMQK